MNQPYPLFGDRKEAFEQGFFAGVLAEEKGEYHAGTAFSQNQYGPDQRVMRMAWFEGWKEVKA